MDHLGSVPATQTGQAAEHIGEIFLLRCDVQHYAWGDTQFIPSLLGTENPQQDPYAELWMGAHPDLPSIATVANREIPLNKLIGQSPEKILGPAVSHRFGGKLPYLFKVLSAAWPLSIQAHPSIVMAKEGFARENEAGIPKAAPNRNYKDENHKPELIVALTDFYALRGFRPLTEIDDQLNTVPEFRAFAQVYQPTPDALRSLYERFMGAPQDEVDSILNPLVQRSKEADRKTPFTRQDREYWLLKADAEFSRDDHRDRGLFSIFLLNLVYLNPGEAMYLPVGVLHAYLEGTGLEVMANSNNVLRGGLTPKYMDVPELIKIITFEGGQTEILRARPMPAGGQFVYETPAPEFELRRIDLSPSRSEDNGPDHGAEILILIASEADRCVTISSRSQSVDLAKGGAVLISHGTAYSITTPGAATLYKATVPFRE